MRVFMRATMLRQLAVSACIALLVVVFANGDAGANPVAPWAQGQTVLLGAKDMPDMPYASPPSEAAGIGQLAKPCANGDQLFAQIAFGGPDVALGSTYSTTPPNQEGGLIVGTIAFRGNASSARTLDNLLSSVAFSTCIQQRELRLARSHDLNFRALSVARLSPTDGLGLATTTDIATRRVTSDPTHTPFNDHLDLVAIRVGNNVALLLLENNDGAFPDARRAQLSSLTEQRLQKLSGTNTSAATTRSSSSSDVGLIVLFGCLVLAAILLAAWLVARRRRDRDDDLATESQ